MTLVGGQQPFTGCAIAEETTWGVASVGTYYTVPLTLPADSLRLKRDEIQQAREFGGTGEPSTFDYGRASVEGSITVTPRFDARWWWILVAHAMRSETVVQDVFIDGTTISAANSGNTHIFAPSATIPIGLTIRMFKSGPTNAGYTETFRGCLITSWTLEQEENGTLRATFNFIGKDKVTAAVGGLTLAAIAGTQLFDVRSMSTGPAYFKTGATLTTLNILSWRFTYDSKLAIDPTFLQTLDTLNKPGIQDQFEITLEIRSQLEQDFGAANKPATEYEAKTASKWDAVYSNGIAVGDKTYAMRLEAPSIRWTAVNNPNSDPGVPPTEFRANCIVGAFDQTGGLPDGLTGAFRVLGTVKTTDEPTADAKFSSL